MKTIKQHIIKNVTLPLDKCEVLLDMPQTEAGEVIQIVLRYALEGTRPVFKDRYKEMFYVSLFNAVDSQKASAEKRADKCRKVALDNASKMKEAKKVLKKLRVSSEGDKNSDDNRTPDALGTSDDDTNHREVISNNTVASDVTSDNLTFSYFISLYGKKDTGNFNTEVLWNELSDDDKRAAIAYVKAHYAGNPDVSSRPWPSQFLKSEIWKEGTSE